MPSASSTICASGGSGRDFSVQTSSILPAEIFSQPSAAGARPLPSISVPLTMYFELFIMRIDYLLQSHPEIPDVKDRDARHAADPGDCAGARTGSAALL